MTDWFMEDIRARSLGLMGSIEKTLKAVPAELLSRPRGGWPLWKQFYHLLYWLDHRFVDPLAFEPPVFHEQAFLDPEGEPTNTLSKETLLDYCEAIRARAGRCLEAITEEELRREQTVRGQNRSRLDMMLGQFTHVSHHLGYICATVRAETGSSIWSQSVSSP